MTQIRKLSLSTEFLGHGTALSHRLAGMHVHALKHMLHVAPPGRCCLCTGRGMACGST